jgi:hypothetical protein
MNINTIQTQLNIAADELQALMNNRKVSASRARAALMKVKKEADILRREILTYSKGLVVKPKIVKIKDLLEPTIDAEDIPDIAPESVTEAVEEAVAELAKTFTVPTLEEPVPPPPKLKRTRKAPIKKIKI